MIPWEICATAVAPDGTRLELRRRGHELVIRAGGHELMSSADEASSKALAELGCAHLGPNRRARLLVGGLGMGFTLRAALDRVGAGSTVEVAELVPEVVAWNEDARLGVGELAGHPLRDERTRVRVGDVRDCLRGARADYDAILLDVDNGPIALAHATNNALYGVRGIGEARAALRPGGVLAVWSLSEDQRFTRRLTGQGLDARMHRVAGSRKGRGREHVVWTARRPGA